MPDKEDPVALMQKCINESRVDVLRSLLAELETRSDFGQLIDTPSPTTGDTLLHLACRRGESDSVRALLSSGANPCVANTKDQLNALHACVDDATRDVFVHELFHAVAQSKLARVCQLLSAGVPLQSTDGPQANTLLHWAASFGTEPVLNMLLDSTGVDVNARNARGDTPLHDAVLRGDATIVKKLLAAGARSDLKNEKGLDCVALAAQKQPHIVQSLSLHAVKDDLVGNIASTNRHDSIASDLDEVCSIVSMETTTNTLPFGNMPNGTVPSGQEKRPIRGGDKLLLRPGAVKVEEWTEWLWPQPRLLHLEPQCNGVRLPRDGRLKFYFDRISDHDPKQLMAVCRVCEPLLAAKGIRIEAGRWWDDDAKRSPIEGLIVCGTFKSGFSRREAYRLQVGQHRVALYAADLAGFRNACFTLCQIIKAHIEGGPQNGAISNGPISSSTPIPTALGDAGKMGHTVLQNTSSMSSDTSNSNVTEGSVIPALTLSDYPELHVRGILADFTGCRVLTVDTLCAIVSRMCLVKANHCFVHFEVRPTDRFSLLYSGKDVFQLQTVCSDLQVTLVPSLDLSTSYVEPDIAESILDQFLNCFPACNAAIKFGPNLTSVALGAQKSGQNSKILEMAKARAKLVYLRIQSLEQEIPNDLPPYCVLCVDGNLLASSSKLLSTSNLNSSHNDANLSSSLATDSFSWHGANICVCLPTSDVGYLCQPPESVIRNAVLAAKLPDKFPVFGVILCDLASGCEIMPWSLAYLPCTAVLGVAWNPTVDIRKFAFLLPMITAEQILLDRSVAPICNAILTLGFVEHELTKLGKGLVGMKSGRDPSSNPVRVVSPLSVIVQLLLNPDSMTLERLTPVAFKRARYELRRATETLTEARKQCPYNFELALVLAEIQFVNELMVMAVKLWDCPQMNTQNSPVGVPVINVGVANLPVTSRTDLANVLLRLRQNFQHSWLARCLPSTLPNALKVFDNLFRALLPPNMHQFGDSLL